MHLLLPVARITMFVSSALSTAEAELIKVIEAVVVGD